MPDLVSQLLARPAELRFGSTSLHVSRQGFFGADHELGVMLSGPVADDADGRQCPADYLNDLLLEPAYREQTYAVVDAFGLLVCRDVRSEHPSYREARGRSSRGRLSQGEYYHHDGCSGPTKPRVVEIRFPHQSTPRDIVTAVAPFSQTVYAMLRHAGTVLALDPKLAAWSGKLERCGQLEPDELDLVQGLVTRSIRRDLGAEAARAFFREVDELVGAYTEPWHMGESRLISNRHPETDAIGTMQHRRAYMREHTGGVANGKLVKRWPAEELSSFSPP